MERKDDQSKPLGICYRLFDFFVKNLAFHSNKLVTLGRTAAAKTKQQEAKEIKISGGRNEGEVIPLLSPTTTIHVEHEKMVEEAVDYRSNERPRGRSQELSVKKRGQQVSSQAKKGTKKTANTKSNEPKKQEEKDDPSRLVLLDRPLQEQTDVSTNLPTPVKPVQRLASNINEQSDAFIQKKKKSFTIEKL